MRIVCFPGAAYDFPLPTNRQQMMRRLAQRGHDVLYIEPPCFPLRSTVRSARTRAALRRWYNRFADVATARETGTARLMLHTELNPYPGADSGVFGRTLAALNQRWTAEVIHRWQASSPSGTQKVVLWLYTPAAVWAVRALKVDLVVYDCVDDYASQPGFRGAEHEQALARRADLIFASTDGLAARLREFNSHTHFSPNVADYDHFATACSGRWPVPAEMRALPRPIFGFVGALDGYKFDAALVTELARAFPHGSVVLVGPAGLVEDSDVTAKQQMEELRNQPNVHVLGQRPYEVLPAYMQQFDVGLIPYARNEYTDQCSPLKLHEYLAAGLPVLATGLPAIRQFADIIVYAEERQDFIGGATRALEQIQSGVAERQAVAQRFTWERKVATAERLIYAALEGR
ncbi:MAG: glycosyltransferase family 1 protein [Herpetosiphon sp.]